MAITGTYAPEEGGLTETVKFHELLHKTIELMRMTIYITEVD
jgi:hypothetical protein